MARETGGRTCALGDGEKARALGAEGRFMTRAVELARRGAGFTNPNPLVGCVIVRAGRVIGEGWHERYGEAHAEANALADCARRGEDPSGATAYVTLEPCQMCAGAIVQSRIPRGVIGCMNPKAGCAGSVLNILQVKEFNHQAEIESGVLGEECSELMKQFFRELRDKKKKQI